MSRKPKKTELAEVATTMERLLTNDHNHGRYSTYLKCLTEALAAHGMEARFIDG